MKIKNNPVFLYTLIFIILICLSVYPFYSRGVTIVWDGDASGQYYPALLYLGQYIRNAAANIVHGNFHIPAFDLSVAMGENIIGSLNYYGFGNPLNVLAVFATKNNLPVVYTLMYILRLYIAGISVIVFLKELNIDGYAAALGAVIYIFSGFGIYGGIMYIEWLSVLFYFPLILAGAEAFIKGKRDKIFLFVLAVSYGALCGFYYLYMSSLALAGYCIFRLMFRNGKAKMGGTLKTIAALLGLYALGIGLVTPVFFFETRAFLNSERNGSIVSVLMDKSLYKPSLALIRDFFLCSVKVTKSYALGIGIVQWIVIAISLFLPNNHRRLQLKTGFLVCMFIISLPFVYWLFNGFGDSYSRWFYTIQLFFVVMFTDTLCSFQFSDGTLRGRTRVLEFALPCVITLLIYANIVRNIWGLFLPVGLDWESEFVKTDEIDKYVDSPVNYSQVISDDEELLRVANDTFLPGIGRPENDAMINDYYGLTYFFSIVNINTRDYVLQNNGYKMQERSYGFNGNAATDGSAGVRYYVSSSGDRREGYELVEQIDFYGDEWYVFENQYYSGFAYMIDADCKEYSENAGTLEEYNQEIMKGINHNAVSNIHYDNYLNVFNCDTDSESGKLIIAIPYDDYMWQLFIDGKKAELEKFNMFLSANIEPGQHHVQVGYNRRIYYVGFMISILCADAIWYICKRGVDGRENV